MERSFPKKKSKVFVRHQRGFMSKYVAKRGRKSVNDDGPASAILASDDTSVEERFEKPTSQSAGFASSSWNDENTEKTLDDFRQDMSAMPMKDVQKLKDKLGLPLFNKTFFCTENSAAKSKPSSVMPKRKSSKCPREESSKIPVSKYRNIYGGEKTKKIRYDPRFDDRCGSFNQYIYETNFGFLDELRENEKQILKAELESAKEEDPLKAERIKEALKRMADRERTKAEIERRKEVIRELRRENNERLRQGMKPIFKTRAEIRRKVLEKKFIDLKKSNKLNKYMKKHAAQFDVDGAGSKFTRRLPERYDLKENVVADSVE